MKIMVANYLEIQLRICLLYTSLLKSVYQLNDKDSITLVDNIYDEVGRLFVDRRNGVPESVSYTHLGQILLDEHVL